MCFLSCVFVFSASFICLCTLKRRLMPRRWAHHFSEKVLKGYSPPPTKLARHKNTAAVVSAWFGHLDEIVKTCQILFLSVAYLWKAGMWNCKILFSSGDKEISWFHLWTHLVHSFFILNLSFEPFFGSPWTYLF